MGRCCALNNSGYHTRSLNWQRRWEGIVQIVLLQPSRALGDYVVSLWDIRVMTTQRCSGKQAMPSVRGLHICASGRCAFTS
ncbi:hypothetical protein EMIT0P291_10297 [Pseudomonas sp. IT-P291]